MLAKFSSSTHHDVNASAPAPDFSPAAAGIAGATGPADSVGVALPDVDSEGVGDSDADSLVALTDGDSCTRGSGSPWHPASATTTSAAPTAPLTRPTSYSFPENKSTGGPNLTDTKAS